MLKLIPKNSTIVQCSIFIDIVLVFNVRCFNAIFVSSHMHQENLEGTHFVHSPALGRLPCTGVRRAQCRGVLTFGRKYEGTRVIVGNIGYGIYPTQDSNSQPVPSHVCADSTMLHCLMFNIRCSKFIVKCSIFNINCSYVQYSLSNVQYS